MGETVTVQASDGSGAFDAYVARPNGDAKAAIIVIQEIFGVNAGIRAKCDDWAARGYLAIAPDLFWRMEPGFEGDHDVPAELEKAFGFFGKNDVDKNIEDIEATIQWVRGDAGVAKVGCVGFCLGGKLAYMAAARTDIDASVGYYGVAIDQMLNEKAAIANPLMLHIPTADEYVDAAAQRAMHEGLDDHPRVTLFDYEGLDHGFAETSGSRRHETGAQLADSRTQAFFAEHLA